MRTAVMIPVAHQGGWDEFLMVAAPLAVIAGLLWLANRRANHIVETAQSVSEAGSTEADTA